jgi:hypothetical protein
VGCLRTCPDDSERHNDALRGGRASSPVDCYRCNLYVFSHLITTSHNTTQHNTTQHNTSQHNTTQSVYGIILSRNLSGQSIPGASAALLHRFCIVIRCYTGVVQRCFSVIHLHRICIEKNTHNFVRASYFDANLSDHGLVFASYLHRMFARI